MNSVLEEILGTGFAKAPNGELYEIKDAISRREGKFIQDIIAEIKPVVSLEVGLAHGISALFICDALKNIPNSRHIVIDPFQLRGGPPGTDWESSWQGLGLHNLREASFEDMIEFYDLPSHQVLPQLEAKKTMIDFAFIDGWHTFDYALIDFFYIDRMLRTGGIVVLDDAHWPSIRKLCRYIVSNRSYTPRSMLPADISKLSIKRRILHYFLSISGISQRTQNIFAPEIRQDDFSLGLHGSCIAFKKEAEDLRRWDYHNYF